MPTPDVVDPTIEEADRRAERAKASLLARVEVLKKRVHEAKQKLDVPSQIARHPWPAVGVAFALGVAVSFGRKGSPPPSTSLASTIGTSLGAFKAKREKKSVGDMILTAAAALGIKLVRDAALSQLSELARQWWVKQGVGGQVPATTPSEAATGRHADLEPFLEH